ncbi:MAG TPA: GDSL-type esterase/lipase family protein [Lachnospiraceae bacterium]|nr:GDSL-type esterase/lipase family protein [Lachnospiraceae bacterium]
MLFSILGDSISTYENVNPSGYSVFYTVENCRRNHMVSVCDTWWYQVILYFHGQLAVNGSYSGSMVSGRNFPAANSDVRIQDLSLSGRYLPDIILIYLGVNDFGNGVLLKGKPLADKFWETEYKDRKLEYFDFAYKEMIRKMKRNYPGAQIFCGTLMRTFIFGNDNWLFPENFNGKVAFEKYNDSIRKICSAQKIVCLDLSEGNVRYETLDGTHPTKAGHQMLAHNWINRLGYYLPNSQVKEQNLCRL